MTTTPKKKEKPKEEKWNPTRHQALALSSTAFEIGYGGARGGGKTDCGQVWLTKLIEHPRYRALVLRRNADDLKDWIARARRMYARSGGTVVGSPPVIRFPSGAEIVTGHLKDENAFEKYQGQEFQRILFEELELIPSEESYLKVLSSCRSTIPELRPGIFTTFNPGGPGHYWIKKRFGLSGSPTDKIEIVDEVSGRRRVFIPSRVDDNPYIVRHDPDYIKFLEALPDGLREQWRYGNWDDPDLKGAYYTQEMRQVQKENRITKVQHQPELPVHTFWDLGMGDMTAIGFFQFVGKEIHCIDYYQNDSEGIKHYVSRLQQLTIDDGYIYGSHNFPHDMEVRELGTGRTRKEVFEQLMNQDAEIVPRQSFEDGINATRVILPRVWFDEGKTGALLDGLRNYKRKWDETRQVYGQKPIHDWASHPADMMRYMALGYSDMMKEPIDRKPLETIRKSQEFDYGYEEPTSRFNY